MSELRTPTLRKGTLLEPYPYQIVRKLGEDKAGMSRLFLAKQVDVRPIRAGFLPFFSRRKKESGRHVVIKIADLQQEDGAFTNTALQREEQRLRTLNHPHILRIFPVAPPGWTAHRGPGREPVYSARAQRLPGQPWFIVLEYLAGGSLETYIDDHGAHGLPIHRALSISNSLASALELIHAKGSAHLDFKPANVVFRSSPNQHEQTTPVMIDFGISERIGATPKEISGTLEYMAPEQIAGASISAEMDSWSLGVVLYQMLTGQHPFLEQAATVEGHDPWERWHTVTTTHDPMPPSQKGRLGAVSPEQAQKLDRLTLDLMAVEPDKRPSMAEVSSRIKNLQDQYPIPPSAVRNGETQKEAGVNGLSRLGRFIAAVLIGFIVIAAVLWFALQLTDDPTRADDRQAVLEQPIDPPESPPGALISVVSAETPSPTKTAAPAPTFTLLDPGAQFTVNGLTGVYVPALDPEMPGFFMMDTEVTRQQYGECVADGLCSWPTGDEINDGSTEAGPAYPIHGLTPSQAEAFASWANGRLPTEDEWEQACLSGDEITGIYPWGGSQSINGSVPANVNNSAELEPVANHADGVAWGGIHDMIGNVAEWTTRFVGGNAAELEYVLKGGSWTTNIGNARCFDVICTQTDPDSLCADAGGKTVHSGLRVVWPRTKDLAVQRALPTPSPTPTPQPPVQTRGLCVGVSAACRTVTVPASADNREKWMCIRSEGGGQVRVTTKGPDMPVSKFNICIHEDNGRSIPASCKDTIASADPKLDASDSRTARLEAQPGNSFRVILRNDADAEVRAAVILDNATFDDNGCR